MKTRTRKMKMTFSIDPLSTKRTHLPNSIILTAMPSMPNNGKTLRFSIPSLKLEHPSKASRTQPNSTTTIEAVRTVTKATILSNPQEWWRALTSINWSRYTQWLLIISWAISKKSSVELLRQLACGCGRYLQSCWDIFSIQIFKCYQVMSCFYNLK